MTRANGLVCGIMLGLLMWAPWAAAQEDPNDIPLEQKKITLNFENAGINEIMGYLSETTGLVIISDTYIDGRVNLLSKQPLSVDEAVVLINTVLREKEYAAVRTGRTLKLVPLSEASKLNIPVTSGNDPDKIVAGDDMVTHIIPIRYANAANLREDLSTLLPSYAVLTANQASNSLIITDTTASIKRFIEIVRAVDTQMSAVSDVKVFHLSYADADTAALLINEVFNPQQATNAAQNANPFSRMFGFRGGPGGRDRNEGQQQSDSAAGGPNVRVVASADERTNAVVVSGPSDVLQVIATVIKELDSNPDEERSLFVYTLKNARSDNLKTVLNNLIQGLQDINEQNRQGTGRGGAGVTNRRSTSDSAAGDFSDETYIESDPDTNSLLIMTSTKNYSKLKPVIDDLDRAVPQVLIKCLLAEVTTNSDLDLGTEFIINNLGSEGQGFIETDLTPGTSGPGSIVNSGAMVTRIVEGDLTWTLRALQSVGQLNVLSRPYILTSNNQTAKITVGQEVPFVRNTVLSDAGNLTNTIEYEDIGIILSVTPNINPDGMVIMDISPEISTLTTDTVPISEDIDAVVIAKRSSQTRVSVKNGQTIVIGGLMQDNNRETVNKVPLLGDLPILGMLFKRTLIEKEKTELLIFLTPQVADNPIDLNKVSENVRQNSDTLQNIDQKPDLQRHLQTQEAAADTGSSSTQEPVR
ncbi:MAG: type II secretion system secretin GspD [Planctomycetaceae bacterium]|nr:type II secretion system secretin GspD [Planctomycetaceae bacterium]